jgi:HEPN domain-containing protein
MHSVNHAQQAAEKALKAVLVAYGVDFPPTHNLVVLRDLAGEVCELPAEAGSLPALSVYAVSSRYPEDAEPVTDKDEVDKAIAVAKATLNWAQEHIESVVSEDGHADTGRA